MKDAKKEGSTLEHEEDESIVYIFDRREGDKPENRVRLGGTFNFAAFKDKVCQALEIPPEENFIFVNTNREPIEDDKTYESLINENDTIYLLKSIDQELTAPTQERVLFIPHYDTLVKSGMYEYYASEGQNPLPFAFAELVDNALAATAGNEGPRSIEVRLMFDDSTGRHAVCVSDNGGGMTPRELNNWAIYRLSKFNSTKVPKRPPVDEDAPRSLNSDISYFGVGGKQAIFFIGSATRMITKTKDCSDVHELSISKEEFERKEKNKESIYSGTIRNRRPGDNSHIPEEEESVRRLIEEEDNRESFTAVVITGVSAQHSHYLKTQFNQWCKQLAHIYHYYLHGPRGNELNSDRAENKFKNIDIYVKLQEKGKPLNVKILHTVEDDLQTQFIRTSASNFEFRAHVENSGCIEGMLRYHPFLYDRETYPLNESGAKVEEINSSLADDAMEALEKDSNAPRGYRPIFECYWNGRLIPYTAVDSLEWCQLPKKRTIIPQECYNRFSGALWTNDAFQVSTNKLTFMDLEVKLKDKATIFNRVVMGQEQRVQISKAFHDWIKECHESHDKQIKFSNFQDQVKRPELTQKKNQSPWSVFNAIEWDGKVFKAGQLIRTVRTIPHLCGTVKRFLLFGDYEGDVFATGGEMEIVQEPVSLYGENKVFALAKLDRTLTTVQVKKFVEEEESKLPNRLVIVWPEGNKLDNNSKVPAGMTIGALKVDIVNGKGEPINKLPGDRRKLLVELKVIWHGSDKEGDKVISNHVCQHGGKNWPYWFRKMENITQLGVHTLSLQVIASESSTVPVMKGLPSHRIRFTVTEAKPDKFTFGMLDIPLRVGVPFQIPLNLFDEFSNPSKFSENVSPVLNASGLELSFIGTSSKGNGLIIKGVVAMGTIPSHAGKDFNLKVTLPGLEEDSQSLKIRLLPGPPDKLVVTPPAHDITIENGNPLQLYVQVQDKAGNVTVNPRLNVVCKLSGQPNLPTYTADCSSSGKCALTGPEVSLKLINNKAQKLKAKVELQHHKEVTPIEKTIIVTPSRNASMIQVFHQPPGSKQKVKLEDGQDLPCVVGSTLSGLSFKILDEGDRELVVDNIIMSKLKVNWVQKTSKDMLKAGNLPEVKAPTSESESKYCQVNLIGSVGIDFSFTLKPTPEVPFILKCTCSNPKLRHGESLKSEIIALITDRYGNKITKLPPGALKLFHVSAPGLKEKEVGIGLSQNGSIVIKNIQFESGPLGPKEVAIQWEKLKYYLRLEVIAGAPAKLALVNMNTTEPLSVYNNTAVSVPLVVQLCDEMGNASSEADVKVILNTDKGVKFTPISALQQKTNAKGLASFGQPVISAPRGLYGIRIRALCHGRSTLEAPIINIRVEPDPTKPVQLSVTFDSNKTCQVGELLPVVSAHIVAEDDSTLKAASAKDLVLKIWHTKDGPPSVKPPPRATTLYPSRKAAGDKEGELYFRDLKVPDVSGPHCMVVQYGPGGSLSLTSKMITFTAKAGPPVRLEPESVPATPTVSNTSKNTGRCLVKTLKLQLKDKYDNLSGENFQGKVMLKVISVIDSIDEIPMLVNANHNNQMEIPLLKGTATVQNIHIQENTNGKDGQEYVLNFQAVLPSKATPRPVPPFTLAFLFYNDVRKQQQMAQLTKERDHLFETIRTYRSLFDTTRQLIQEMRVSVYEAAQEEHKLKSELKKHNIADQHLHSTRNVDSYLATVVKKRDEMTRAPRRQCNLNPGPRGDPEILGKVAHLAHVDDDDVARVLSWHMASDMDCVVTLTTAKAKEVYRESNGQQQVLPLDSIYKQRLPEWTRPLPHIRNGPRNYVPSGNPVYARDKLIFHAEAANCKIVFGMLLGDTIILDDLDCANKYRQEVVKNTHCPTILTRSGDRIRSNGKFGGLQNKAPVVERMRGAVFAAPVPITYHTLSTQVEQLQAYKQAQIKHQQAKSDLDLQLRQGQTDQMKIKHRECHDAETQLRMIEERLGMTPTQYDMPASPATMLHTELSTPLSRSALTHRRVQGSSTPVVNGTSSSTRTRRASPLNTEEPRSSKRIRKS